MIFKEKFLDLAHPFFSMNELDDDATEEIFEKYYEVEGRIELLKKKLADLAEGDQAALDVLTAFLSDENSTRFLQSEKANAFLKILALASNITSDTWNKDAADAYPIRAVFLTEDNGIDPPYSASGTPLTNFFFNSDDVVNSVGFVDFRTDPDSNRLARQATWSPQGRDTVEVWTVILLLENIDNVDGCVAIFSSQGDAEKARSYLKYHLIMGGHKLTLPVPSTVHRAMPDVQKGLVATTDYTQFSEPFAMLGEVNSCENILDTYLSTYHVLENYMIRREVTSVFSNSTGRSFQRVRDFKRLGQQTDDKEIAHLNKLFSKSWEIMIGECRLQETLEQSFEDARANDAWDNDSFDDFLKHLGLQNGGGNPVTLSHGFHNQMQVKKNFPKLVYAIRCSIVHNKATEFHLSNEELRRNSIIALVIERICLPVMYRLAFGLPSSAPEDNPIHYPQRELMFY